MERKRGLVNKAAWSQRKSEFAEAAPSTESVDRKLMVPISSISVEERIEFKTVNADYKDKYKSINAGKIESVISEDVDYDFDVSTIPEPMDSNEGTILYEVGIPTSFESVTKELASERVENCFSKSNAGKVETVISEDVDYDSDVSTIPEPMDSDEGTILYEVGISTSFASVKKELASESAENCLKDCTKDMINQNICIKKETSGIYESTQDMINQNTCIKKEIFENNVDTQNKLILDKVSVKRRIKLEDELDVIRKNIKADETKECVFRDNNKEIPFSVKRENESLYKSYSIVPTIKENKYEDKKLFGIALGKVQDKQGEFTIDYSLMSSLKSRAMATTAHYQGLPSQGVCCKKPLLSLQTNGTDGQVADTDLLPPDVPSQKITLSLLRDQKKHSVSFHPSVTQFAPAEFSSDLTKCDHHIPIKFDPGNDEDTFLRLYKNDGKANIGKYFKKLILQWNPKWFQTQAASNVYSPLCESYPSVKYFYRDLTHYCNTYIPLHLLHIRQKIFDRWQQKEDGFINCKCLSVEKLQDSFKICCFTELEATEVLPKRDDILWCRHSQKEALLYVENVKRKIAQLETPTKLKVYLESLKNLNLEPGDEFRLRILSNVDVEILQIEALQSLSNKLKKLILRPEKYAKNIEIVRLSPTKPIKEQRDDILKEVNSEHISVIVIETYDKCDTVLLITHLAYSIGYGQKQQVSLKGFKYKAKILICLTGKISFHNLVRRLAVYNPVLVVRTKQIALKSDLMQFTLEERVAKGEKTVDILNNNCLFITMFSSFGSFEKMFLSKINKLTCIVDDAHLCTEVETAVPLSLMVDKLLLFGKETQWPVLPSSLRHHRYHISFFARLFKAKQYASL